MEIKTVKSCVIELSQEEATNLKDALELYLDSIYEHDSDDPRDDIAYELHAELEDMF